MKRKQKYIVENRRGQLIGIFKSVEEAKAYVEKEVAYVRDEFIHAPEAESGIPAPDIYTDEWVSDEQYVLDLYNNFEYNRRTFTWEIRILHTLNKEGELI